MSQRPTRQRRSEVRPARSRLIPRLVSFLFIFVAVVMIIAMVNGNGSNDNKQSTNPLTTMKRQFFGDQIGDRLQQAWQKQLSGTDQNVSIAIYSPVTGQTYRLTRASHGHKFHTASTVKVGVMAALLLDNNGQLNDTENSLAQTMIENSNNDATSTLFDDYIGGQSGLQDVYNRVGMDHTKVNQAWGLTTTTASDQVKLLNNIFYKSNLLTPDERQQIYSLMDNVEEDQSWGTSAGAASYQLKNGWLFYGSDQWIVNSIGHVTLKNGVDYTIAIYTDGSSSMDEGETLIENLAKATAKVMKNADLTNNN